MACGREDLKPCATCGTCPTCGYGGYRPWWGVNNPWWVGDLTWPNITYTTTSTVIPNCTCNNLETCPHRNQGFVK